MKQTLNQLLVELDGFKQSGAAVIMENDLWLTPHSEGIIVIGATNFPQSLDKWVASSFAYFNSC